MKPRNTGPAPSDDPGPNSSGHGPLLKAHPGPAVRTRTGIQWDRNPLGGLKPPDQTSQAVQEG